MSTHLPEGFLARAKQRRDRNYQSSAMASISAHSPIHFARTSEGINVLYLMLDGITDVQLFLPKAQAGLAEELALAINSVLAKREAPEPEPEHVTLGLAIDDDIPF